MEINKVINKECLDGMKDISDKSIDMILCDLPYGTTRNDWDVIIPFIDLWAAYERIIKDNGAIILTCAEPFTTKLISSNYDLFRYDLIWEKNISTGFLNANKMPMRIHENIAVFYKSLPTYNPQKTPGHRKAIAKGSARSTSTNYGKFIHSDYASSERHPTSILRIPRDNESYFHPTQKPVPLFEFFIKTYTNPGELVLDNCMGSGTTAIACMRTDRNFIGFEADSQWFSMIEERIKKESISTKARHKANTFWE